MDQQDLKKRKDTGQLYSDSHDASLNFVTDRINILHLRPAKYCFISEDLQRQHLED